MKDGGESDVISGGCTVVCVAEMIYSGCRLSFGLWSSEVTSGLFYLLSCGWC